MKSIISCFIFTVVISIIMCSLSSYAGTEHMDNYRQKRNNQQLIKIEKSKLKAIKDQNKLIKIQNKLIKKRIKSCR